MQLALGVVVMLLALLCWVGQLISWFAPITAARWSLAERQEDVEPTYWLDIRGEALWDLISLWPMVVVGWLLIVDSTDWAYWGLVGGGMYVYFSGRGIITRMAMLKGGYRIGSAQSVNLGLAALTIWGLMGLTTVVSAWTVLAGR